MRSHLPTTDSAESQSNISKIPFAEKHNTGSEKTLLRLRSNPFVVVAAKVPFNKYAQLCYKYRLRPAIINECNFWQAVRALSIAKVPRAWIRWQLSSITKPIKSHRGKKCCKPGAYLKFPTSLGISLEGARIERWALKGLKGKFFALCTQKTPKCKSSSSSSSSCSSYSSSSSSDSSSDCDKSSKKCRKQKCPKKRIVRTGYYGYRRRGNY